MYLEIDEGYWEHPKTLDLCARLEDSKADTYPPRMWKWAVRSARTGQLGAISSYAIEKAVHYEPMDGRCATALIEAGFIDKHEDGTMEIHDWMDYTGGALKRMEDKAEENRRRRADAKAKHESKKSRNRGGIEQPPYRNRTGTNPSQTRQGQSSQDPDPLSGLSASDPDPTRAKSNGHANKPTGWDLLVQFGNLRRQILNLQSAPGTEKPKDTNGKAADFAAQLTADEAMDVEATMRLALEHIRDGAVGWNDPRIVDPSFAFGAWKNGFVGLREAIHGCAPKAKPPQPVRAAGNGQRPVVWRAE